jgi:hypothetical protein
LAAGESKAVFLAGKKGFMVPRQRWAVLGILFLPMMCFGSLQSDFWQPRGGHKTSVMSREPQLWRPRISNSRFADVPHTSARFRCQATRLPEALTTPNPLLDGSEAGLKVKVSFVIGIDGRVYSPLILESASSREDRTILRTIRSWRYRPAMCNGVPTETEGKIEFSSW